MRAHECSARLCAAIAICVILLGGHTVSAQRAGSRKLALGEDLEFDLVLKRANHGEVSYLDVAGLPRQLEGYFQTFRLKQLPAGTYTIRTRGIYRTVVAVVAQVGTDKPRLLTGVGDKHSRLAFWRNFKLDVPSPSSVRISVLGVPTSKGLESGAAVTAGFKMPMWIQVVHGDALSEAPVHRLEELRPGRSACQKRACSDSVLRL